MSGQTNRYKWHTHTYNHTHSITHTAKAIARISYHFQLQGKWAALAWLSVSLIDNVNREQTKLTEMPTGTETQRETGRKRDRDEVTQMDVPYSAGHRHRYRLPLSVIAWLIPRLHDIDIGSHGRQYTSDRQTNCSYRVSICLSFCLSVRLSIDLRLTLFAIIHAKQQQQQPNGHCNRGLDKRLSVCLHLLLCLLPLQKGFEVDGWVRNEIIVIQAKQISRVNSAWINIQLALKQFKVIASGY